MTIFKGLGLILRTVFDTGWWWSRIRNTKELTMGHGREHKPFVPFYSRKVVSK